MTSYRKDIDVLRGLAVLSVVLYHYVPSAFPGGYIGVDVFFVISGYLITQRILVDLKCDVFSLAFFFSRRAARLLPALSLMLLVCLALGWCILSADSFQHLGREAISASFFFSNLFYARRTGYWDANGDFPLLLHTWSLSVEEQYYLIVPVLLLIAARLSSRGALVLAYFIFAASVAATVLLLNLPDRFLFFLTPFRMSELALGGVLAASASIAILTANVRRILLCAAAVGFLFSVFFMDSNDAFPGRAAIFSSLSAALFLKLGETSGDVDFKGRPTQALRKLGLISYPVYLWHWPVLVFLERILSRSASMFELILCFVVTCLIAIFSHSRVEMPIRNLARSASRKSNMVGVFCWLTVAVSGLASFGIYHGNGFPSRLPSEVIRFQPDDIMAESYVDCMATRQEVAIREGCVFGNVDAQTKVLFWGDSHAVIYANELTNAPLSDGHQTKLISKGGCPPLLGLQVTRDGDNISSCNQFLANAEFFIRDYQPDIIVLIARWPYYADGNNELGSAPVRISLSPQQANAVLGKNAVLALGIKNTLEFAVSIGSKVIIVGPTPELGESPSECLITRSLLSLDLEVCGQTRIVTEKLLSNANEVLESAAQGSVILPIVDSICDQTICFVLYNGNIVYRDSNHIDEAGAAIFFPKVEREILWLLKSR